MSEFEAKQDVEAEQKVAGVEGEEKTACVSSTDTPAITVEPPTELEQKIIKQVEVSN